MTEHRIVVDAAGERHAIGDAQCARQLLELRPLLALARDDGVDVCGRGLRERTNEEVEPLVRGQP